MPNRTKDDLWERQPGESAQAYEAFAIYRDMGSNRSLRVVAEQLSKSDTLIKRWSREKKWGERCRAYDNHLDDVARQEELHMNPDEATSLKQLFLSMLPKDGGIVVGTVTKESPLTIQIENDEKLEISGSALLVPRNLTDYQVKVDIALADGKIDSNTHVGGAHGHKFQLFDSRGGGVTGLVGCPLEGDKDKPVGDYHKVESSKESAHIHSLKTFSIESGLLTVYNALKTGESVYLLRFNDGKSYYALERAIV